MDPNVHYADEHARELGTRLLDAVRALRADPDDEAARARATDLSRQLRRGPILLPGEVLGERFVLCERVRDGALAATWRAHDLADESPVAVKVLHGHQVGNAAAVARFAASAEAMARIDDPQIPGLLHPQAEHEGFAWFATEWVGDRTLEDVTLAGNLDAVRALQATLDVGWALHRAHAKGILHEAIEPGRILLTSAGAMLTDMGLAAPGQLGSAYVAPEVLDSQASVDVSADIYGLAMTTAFALYQKQLPFWVLRDPDRLIGELAVDDEVRDALRAATSWDPQMRPSTVAAFLEQITAPVGVLEALAESARESGRADVAADHYAELVTRTDGHPDVRVGYARTLVALDRLEEASEQLLQALRSDQLSAIEETLSELRTLSAVTGRWEPLLEVLEERAEDPDGPRAALYLEIGRIYLDHLDRAEQAEQAWRQALDLHKVRAHAREAIEGLMAIAQAAGDWETFLTRGKSLIPYLKPDARPALHHRLGRVYLDKLGDQQHGLHWLQKAYDGGHRAGELARTLERIRSDRGDWREVIRLMKLQADAQSGEAALATLRRAARIARFAAFDNEERDAILTMVSELAPDDAVAAGMRAQRADYAGELDEAQLWYGRLPDVPPAGDEARWMSDQLSHARLLLHIDDYEGGRRVVDLILAAEPSNLAALALLGDIQLDEGALDEARVTWTHVLNICHSEELSPMARHARLALGLCAWLGGDLATARTHGQHLVEAYNEDVEGWWAITRAALWSLSQTDLPPSEAWLRATPLCFAPHEALTRLLAGVLTEDGVTGWLALDPLGAATIGLLDGRTELERAAVVVELLVRRGLVGPDLFADLAEHFPEAGLQVETTRLLWIDESTSDSVFPVADCYTWAPTRGQEFDPGIHRTVLQPDVDVLAAGARQERLGSSEALQTLFSRDGGPLPIEDAAGPQASTATPALAPERTRRFVVQLKKPIDGVSDVTIDDESLAIGGSAPDLRLHGTDDARCVLVKAGTHCYLTEGEDVKIDGVARSEWRLHGGETIRVGRVELVFHALEPGQSLPTPAAPPPRAKQVAPKDDDDLALGMPETWEEEPTIDAAYDEVPIKYTPAPNQINTETQPAVGSRRNRPLLIILDGDQAGRVVTVNRSTFNIGRGRGNHLQISGDAKSSRHHATLLTADGVCRIRDNRSANGTYVNGRRIREHILQVGDKVLIGDRMLQFRLGSPTGTTDELELDDPVTDEAPELSLEEEEAPPEEAVEERVMHVNSALSRIIATIDQHEGAGTGVAALQRLVTNAPSRFAPLFTRVEVVEEGLRAATLVKNLDKRLGTRQTLDAALLDLTERALARGCANLDDDAASKLIHQVARSNLRAQLTSR